VIVVMDVAAVAFAPPVVGNVPSAAAPSSAAIAAHLPLVWRVARQVARRLPANVDAADLVGAGTLGLIGALGRYEEARCDRFSAYAEFRIRGAILDQLREMDWLPRSLRSKRKRLDDARAQLHQRLGRAPATHELAAALGTTNEGIERMRRDLALAEVVSGDAAEAVVDDRGTPGTTLEDRELRARLGRALASLPARHQHVLNLYYVDEQRLREIGAELGVTESRVCQILREAVVRLRASLLDD
jgi:RNA polymerase sigma factor for flagellar operon FliA